VGAAVHVIVIEQAIAAAKILPGDDTRVDRRRRFIARTASRSTQVMTPRGGVVTTWNTSFPSSTMTNSQFAIPNGVIARDAEPVQLAFTV
jgi:hypothetical protein